MCTRVACAHSYAETLSARRTTSLVRIVGYPEVKIPEVVLSEKKAKQHPRGVAPRQLTAFCCILPPPRAAPLVWRLPMKPLKLIAGLLLIPPLGWIAAISSMIAMGEIEYYWPPVGIKHTSNAWEFPRWMGHMGDVVSSHLRGDPVGGGCPP